MDKEPFPIIVENSQEKIDPMTRLNFGRVHTVEHNVKVSKVGRILDEYLPLLEQYFLQTIAGPQLQAATIPSPSHNEYITKNLLESESALYSKWDIATERISQTLAEEPPFANVSSPEFVFSAQPYASSLYSTSASLSTSFQNLSVDILSTAPEQGLADLYPRKI
jgi:hypothetical protein